MLTSILLIAFIILVIFVVYQDQEYKYKKPKYDKYTGTIVNKYFTKYDKKYSNMGEIYYLVIRTKPDDSVKHITVDKDAFRLEGDVEFTYSKYDSYGTVIKSINHEKEEN